MGSEIMKSIYILVTISLLILSSQSSAGKVKWSVIKAKVNALQKSDKKSIWVDIVDTTKPMYVAGAFMTIEAPFKEAAASLIDFDNYDSIFRYVSKVEGLGSRKGSYNKYPRYYAEGKAAFIHAWGLGKIDSLDYVPEETLLLKIRPVRKSLQKIYLKKLRGKIKYTIRDIHIDGYLTKIDSNHCRISVLGWSTMKTKIPRWILSIIMKIVLPQFITDLEDHALKREKYFSHLERDYR